MSESSKRSAAWHDLFIDNLYHSLYRYRVGLNRDGFLQRATGRRSAGVCVQKGRAGQDQLCHFIQRGNRNSQCFIGFSNGTATDLDEHEPRWLTTKGFQQDSSKI